MPSTECWPKKRRINIVLKEPEQQKLEQQEQSSFRTDHQESTIPLETSTKDNSSQLFKIINQTKKKEEIQQPHQFMQEFHSCLVFLALPETREAALQALIPL